MERIDYPATRDYVKAVKARRDKFLALGDKGLAA